MPVRSVMEPSGTGTLSEVPSRRPAIGSRTRLVAFAAPVEAGTTLMRPPGPGAGRPTTQVEQLLVVGIGVHSRHQPGAAQRLRRDADHRHEAVRRTGGVGDDVCAPGRNSPSFTPTTNVVSASLGGAEMMTRRPRPRRVPWRRCALVNRPVDSITTSPRALPQPSAFGSGS